MEQTNSLELELKNIAINIMADESLKDINTLKTLTLKLYDKLCILDYQQQQTLKENTSYDSLELITAPKANATIIQNDEQTQTDNFEQLLEDFKDIPEFEPIIGTSNFSNQEDLVKTNNTNDNLSLNDKLNREIKIGLNDKLTYIKYLFQEDSKKYLEVMKYLKECQHPSEAIHYIEKLKFEYNNWEGKLAIEKRFLSSVLRKFKGS